MRHVYLLCFCAIISACAPASDGGEQKPESLKIRLQNNGAQDVSDALVTLDRADVGAERFEALAQGSVLVRNATDTSFVQWNDLDRDGQYDQLAFTTSLTAGEEKEIRIAPAPQDDGRDVPKRTHAELSVKEGGAWEDRVYMGGAFTNVDELRVPQEHTDHSFYIRYEGPGWESDKVGYRFYLDWRNAIDIFGKKRNALVLKDVGQDGFDSYHEMADWGMDILKVGEALGIGGFGCWAGGKAIRLSQTDSVYCEIPLDGPLKSMVRTYYYGWKTPYGKSNVISEISIAAGKRMSRHDVQWTNGLDSLCAGIVKHENATVLTDVDSAGWCYLATWGRQSLANDMLGMAVFFEKDALYRLDQDAVNHVVLLRPSRQRTVRYYFAACWEQEPAGIRTQDGFEDYLKSSVDKLNHPVQWAIVDEH